MPTLFTPEQDQVIADEYRQGAPYIALAKLHGCSVKAISNAVHRAGVEPRTNGRKFSEAEERSIADRYSDGATIAALMDEFKVGPDTLRKMLNRHGVSIRNRGRDFRVFSDAEVQEMARRWKAGESQTKIAQAFGSSQITVSRTLAKHGIRTHTRRPEGEAHGSWKGGRHTRADGYVFVRVPAVDDITRKMRNSTGYIAEHRLVVARDVGRPLSPGESVHHINGDRSDNRLENLQLRSGPHGKGVVAHCRSCGSTDIEVLEI